MNDYEYVGTELEVFALATNWKAYYRSHLSKFIRGQVLEVGAGLGGTTRVLCDGTSQSWSCLEPDPRLASRLADAAKAGEFPLVPDVQCGTIADLPAERQFDSILYIDVLEHIEDDRAELERAGRHLRAGGHLVVLCPAHNFLFTKFDRAIGHYRRYDKQLMRQVAPPGLELKELFYLDSVGMLLSIGNRLLLRSGSPTAAQIRLWDRVFVPASKIVDPLLGWRLGKTIVGVWIL